jgi:HSP20 family protein
MSTWDQFRERIGEAWEALAEGWRELWKGAGRALTRFHPLRAGEQPVDVADQEHGVVPPRWGLLPAEVLEEDDQIVVKLEAPGMERQDFDLEVRNDRLFVRGEKRATREQRRGHYHIMERAYGRFERAIPLPIGIDESGARATYRQGVLRITLPRPAHARTHRIEIEGK